MNTKTKKVDKPVLSFKMKDGKIINLWALDAGQFAVLAQHRSFEFDAGRTASLIYEQSGAACGGHQATESNLNNTETWAWVQEWMTKGFASEGLIELPKADLSAS